MIRTGPGLCPPNTRPTPSVRLRSLALGLLFALGTLALGGCSVPVEVKAREEITFAIDLDAILSSNKINKAKVFPGGKVPPDLQLTLPFWFKLNYDLSQNKDIQKYKDKIRDLTLAQFSYQISQNTLSVDLPSHNHTLEVFLAEPNTKDVDDFTKIGFFHPIPASRINISDRLQLVEDGADTAGGYFQKFNFSLGLKGSLRLDGSQSSTIPSGRLVLKVLVDVIFTVDIDLQNPDL